MTHSLALLFYALILSKPLSTHVSTTSRVIKTDVRSLRILVHLNDETQMDSRRALSQIIDPIFRPFESNVMTPALPGRQIPMAKNLPAEYTTTEL